MQEYLIFSHGVYRAPIINMTPHDVVVMGKMAHVLYTIPSSGSIRLTRSQSKKSIECAIINESTRSVFQDSFPTYSPFDEFTVEITDERIVDEQSLFSQVFSIESSMIIVSMPVADYLIQNNTFPTTGIMIPDTGPESVVRDRNGLIMGVTRFIVYQIPEK